MCHSFYVGEDTGGVTLSYTNNVFKVKDNKYFTFLCMYCDIL